MLHDKKIISIIPARKNSKEIPNKNIYNFMGQPLVEWSIQAALKSKYIDFTIVSSDCPVVEKIVNIYINSNKYTSRKLGFSRRPEDLATDKATTESVISNVVDRCLDNNLSFDYIVLLQPTSPIRKGFLVDKCLKEIYANGADSLLTVNKFTPFFWSKAGDDVMPMYDTDSRPMRQDIEEEEFLYYENGNIYIIRWDTYIKKRCRIGDNPILFTIDETSSKQIDSYIDMSNMEFLLKNEKKTPLDI